MSLGLARPAVSPWLGAGAWGNALVTAVRCVLVLLAIAVIIQMLIVVEARPQDLITGVHGMADIIRRAMPPDFAALPAAFWPTLQTLDIALFGTIVGIRSGRIAFNLPRAQVSREAVHRLYINEAA